MQRISPILVAVALTACTAADSGGPSTAASDAAPHLVASSDIDAGRYLVTVGGCNDCHTNGYLATGGDVPEEDWLTGSPVGWRGPWGTSYAKNLRLAVAGMTEDDFVALVHSGGGLPPMPWVNVAALSDTDARNIYRYIRSLGGKGEAMPLPVGPDEEPVTPYISLAPIEPE